MNTKSYPAWFALVSVTFAFANGVAAQTTLFSQNFDGIATQTISNSPTSTNLGTGTGAFVVQTAQASGTATLEIADKGSGNHVARYTDNSTAGTTPNLISAIFSGVNATNYLVLGSFDFKPLAVTGTAPSFIFVVNANGAITNSADSSVQIQFSNNGGSATNVSYFTAGAYVNNVVTLSAGTNYRMNLIADYSTTGVSNTDSYTFTITNLDTASVTYSSSVIQTRANASLTPNRIAFYGNPSTVANASPFFEVDNINFVAASAIPEPGATAALMGAVILGTVALRRSRRSA